MKKLFTSALVISLLTSCASIKTGRTQQVRINSTPPGATCSYQNKTSNGSVQTPGVAQVNRSMSSLMVSCQAPGYASGETKVEYWPNWWTIGNVFLLGLPIFYDFWTGAISRYPESVEIPLKPTGAAMGYNPNSPINNIPQYQQQGYGQQPQMEAQNGYMVYQENASGQQQAAPQNPYEQFKMQQMYQQNTPQQMQAPQGYQPQANPSYGMMPQTQSYQQPVMPQNQVQQPSQEQLIREMMQEKNSITGVGLQ